MRYLVLTLLLSITSQLALANCPTELSKSHLLGKIQNPTKSYTPIRSYCSDEILNIFSNCIESNSSGSVIYFGSREKHFENQKHADCPFGYATEVKNNFLRIQKLSGKPVCLSPCESIAVGKFFRDEQRFGLRKILNVGDMVYIPELKGLKCGDTTHKGCVRVSHFLEYTNNPVIDFYSGTCTSTISRGECSNQPTFKLPNAVSIYKVNAGAVEKGETQLSSEAPNAVSVHDFIQSL